MPPLITKLTGAKYLFQQLWLLIIAVQFGGSGCRTFPPMPPADLTSPGWTVHHAQAVWRPNTTAPELTGELLYASHSDGETFVQFIKHPFPLVTARADINSWHIEFTQADKACSGTGRPPKKLLWFQFPLSDLRTTAFQWTSDDTNHWRLENSFTGETLEAVLIP